MSTPPLKPSDPQSNNLNARTDKPARPFSYTDTDIEGLGKRLLEGLNISGDLDFELTRSLDNLPPEILQRIFNHIYDPSKAGVKAIHQQLPRVSKNFNENVQSLAKHWLNKDYITLKDFGFKSTKEAIQYVIDTKLTHVDLRDFRNLTCDDLKKLSLFGSIVKLSINTDNLTADELTRELREFKNLEGFGIVVGLLNDKLTGDVFAGILSQNPNLLSLSIENSLFFSVTDKFAEELGKLKNLEELTFKYCSQLGTNETFISALGSLVQLKKLNVIGISKDININIKALGNLTNLKELDVSDTDITGNLLVEELKKLSIHSKPKLESLNLMNCKHISEDQLIEIAAACPNLITFTLGGNNNIYISFDKLKAIVKSLKHLKNLHIKSPISGSQMIEITKISPHLERLIVDLRPRLSFDQFDKILSNLNHLLYFDLWGYSGLTEEQKANLFKKYPMIMFKLL